MTKAETLKFLNKIKAYYYNFSLEDYVKDEWIEKLKPYSKEDIEEKFEEHLHGEYALNPPQLHFLTKYLKTEDEKQKAGEDFIIKCNLCGDTMFLQDYERKHYKKCLLIKTLIPILQKRGEEVNYEILDVYDYETLDRIYMKYEPDIKKDLKEIVEVFK